ncbi:type II toxin-antitoxin system RelE/ParE family toxin [Chitinophaga rhizosphaerae]|uniref:type II toxin-antitoxin system RelE/ParE family toxin n=1 Tax=Chitinophaga rhizosphaerae TaxID=1864947 RepID=UPI000F808EB2|nr:type II toxin-antitoxin system RelE/ParE family toxin [Chitinophaga rhizosphaerae]
MITSFLHKGLRLYYEKGKATGLPTAHLRKIGMILTALDAVTAEEDIKQLGSGIHLLRGIYAGYWSITITGNYRIIFRFDQGEVFNVDYIDYH